MAGRRPVRLLRNLAGLRPAGPDEEEFHVEHEPNAPAEGDDNTSGGTSSAEAGSNDEAGDKVVIGFSAPAADHGWMGSITDSAQKVAKQYDDVELRVASGTNEVNLQISQVETFINDGVDAIVLLPFDGAAMTPVALQAM